MTTPGLDIQLRPGFSLRPVQVGSSVMRSIVCDEPVVSRLSRTSAGLITLVLHLDFFPLCLRFVHPMARFNGGWCASFKSKQREPDALSRDHDIKISYCTLYTLYLQ